MGQNMATTMMAHAQRKAAERAAILDEKSKQLEDYRAELEEAAKRIEEGSAYLVQITVPEALKITPARAVGHERPQAATTWTGDAPGLATRRFDSLRSPFPCGWFLYRRHFG